MNCRNAALLSLFLVVAMSAPSVAEPPPVVTPINASSFIVRPIPTDNIPFGVSRDGNPLTTARLNTDYFAESPRIVGIYRDGGHIKLEGPRRVSLVGSEPITGFPPKGDYYGSQTEAEAQYAWRWIGMDAPDLVVEFVKAADADYNETWFVPTTDLASLNELAKHLPNVKPLPFDDSLVSQLANASPCGTGRIPAVRLVWRETPADTAEQELYVNTLKHLQAAIEKSKLPSSPARLEIQRRLKRSPREAAEQLLAVYGKQLSTVQYIPALALVGRLRQDRINGDDQTPVSPIVLAAVEPYVSGTKPTIDGKAGGSGIAGHLIFGELATLTGDKRYVELVKAAADLAFDADGKPRESMPSHNEMSDAVFMGCPILAQAGKLTGDEKYFEACLRNLRFMQKLCVRDDGIYRHSPLDEAAWGRGNGFPALGLAWSLGEIPDSFAGRAEILAAFQKHMAALLPYQDATGCWHQVIDRPESYREFTCTAMITFAMARGVRMGWLDREKFAPAIAKGWDAIRARIAADGSLVDVCTGTGKQKSLRDYYDRTAILGRDDRGGAMALMVTTEMQLYLGDGK